MAAPSSPVSDLSALNSEDFDEDANRSRSDRGGSTDAFDDNDSSVAMPPSKRRRTTKRRVSRPRIQSPTANGSSNALAQSHKLGSTVDPDADIDVDADGYGTDVSSDSSGMGSVDGSPLMVKELGMNDEYSYGEEQVQVCQWDYCEAGDLGNQDELVKHINDVHVVEAKQRSFVCEWFDCKAKFRPQMSAYALRAHLRSHTKEKPFFCTLPECDRSFTRSDALAKHMRTVHETEGIRTADHYWVKKSKGADAEGDGSKSTGEGGASKPPTKLKLVFNSKSSAPSTPQQPPIANGASDPGDEDTTMAPPGPLSPATRDDLFGPLPETLQFTEAEAQMPRDELFRLLRRQLHWAEEESEDLEKQIQVLEKDKRQEWLNKELVPENVMEAEHARARRRGVFDPNGQDSTFGEMEELEWADEPMSAEEKARILGMVDADIETASHLPMKGPGPQPWYRLQAEVEAEARARATAAAKAKAEARARAGRPEEEEEEEGGDGDEEEDMDADADDGAQNGDVPEDEDMGDDQNEDDDDPGEDEAEAEAEDTDLEKTESEDENETKVVIMTLGPGGSGPTSVTNDERGGDETEEDEEMSSP